MKLTCPECTTQFLINPEAIGSNGRTVRCSQCSATWFVAAEPDIMELRDDLEPRSIEDALASADGVQNSAAPSREDRGFASQAQESWAQETHAAQDESPEIPPSLAPHAAFRAEADKKKARRNLFGVSMVWGITFSIFALVLLTTYVLRAQITEKFPGTLAIYKKVGVNVPVAGLEFYAVEWRYVQNEGEQVFFIDGKIRNVDVKPRNVSLIKLSLKNADGEVLTSWVVEPALQILQPGKNIEFATQYPNPPIEAVSLVTGFADEADTQTNITPVVTR
ncbi:MAG: hypothetical protein COA69_06790 [Robiginitomaculum sp.]|nr:MAG: hypothetical protein COA69_06790 [Robiginitomaculum sp.]